MREFPKCQAIPYPTKVSFQLDGVEMFAYNYKNIASRPYIFPVTGPSGRIITRIGHPRDPVSHRHHYSIWLGHQNVNDVNFWEESVRSGRQVPQAIAEFEDSEKFCSMTASVNWQDKNGWVLLNETKKISMHPIEDGQYLIGLELCFSAVDSIRLGKTPFGFLGVRVAKTMGVHDGGGKISNSEGQINEEEVFRKTARWCDYSGSASAEEWNGITIIDHPSNLNHPPKWHVRNDGWMCPSLFLDYVVDLGKDEELKLKYILVIHRGEVEPSMIEKHYDDKG